MKVELIIKNKIAVGGKTVKEQTSCIFKSMECTIALTENEKEEIARICNKVLKKLET
ncbi:hypothetical protein ACH5BK_02640 [Arcobacter sp. YIC-80]|uniref:hypothetical protein n=1 Tax=Arcobacter sp. YIC-80 TaxID=3376683 RepID=UPI003850AA26